MRPLRRLLLATTLLAASGLASASPANPLDGVEFKTLPTPQPTEAGARKVEVTEFFAYYCPHCNAFEPLLADWLRKQGDTVVLRRVHVPRDPSVLPQQRLFYTLEAMGLVEQYHAKVFAAMHGEQRLKLANDEQVFDWATRAGIDRARFIETYRSFGVQQKMRRAGELMAAYGVTHWPMVAIDGRFLTSPGMVAGGAGPGASETQLMQGTLAVMDQLVAKAKADKK
jgi:thiol:disulfide interchange protein DsbA